MSSQIPLGKCQCGCGADTNVARYTSERDQCVKGRPARFVRGHHVGKREQCLGWKGGRYDNGRDYPAVYEPEHPRANSRGYAHEHVVVVEAVLGRFMRPGEHVHHVDGTRSNNAHSNLVVCSAAYHKLLHRRQRAFDSCGCADWRYCSFCKTWDAPGNLYVPKKEGGGCYHSECMRSYMRCWRQRAGKKA